MKTDISELQTVKNYAYVQRVTTTCVYNWIEKNLVKSIEIDGVKFIVQKKPL